VCRYKLMVGNHNWIESVVLKQLDSLMPPVYSMVRIGTDAPREELGIRKPIG